MCLPVWARAAAHFKRFPDPILKALKRPGSNLTIKSKQWLLRKSLRLYNTANFEGHKDMPMVTREGASVPIRTWRRPPPLPRWRGCKCIFSCRCDRKGRRGLQRLPLRGPQRRPSQPFLVRAERLCLSVSHAAPLSSTRSPPASFPQPSAR